MQTKEADQTFIPPIYQISPEALKSGTIVVGYALGFLLPVLPAVAYVALLVAGFWGGVCLIGEFNVRRRIAREVKAFRQSLDADEPVV